MSAPTLAGVLWDMDGTLIDSEPLWLDAEHEMLGRYGIEMGAETNEQLIGSGLWEAAEHFRALGVPLSADDIVAEWVRHVGAGMDRDGLIWRPGARELLADLADHGIPCALVTMSVRALADRMVAQLPAGTFRAVIAGDEVAHEKPHPDPYLRGAAALGVDPEACLAFEDSPTGVRSAVSAGSVTIGVTNLLDLGAMPAHEVWPTLSGITADALGEHFVRLSSALPRERSPQRVRPALRSAAVSLDLPA